jgi:hypothetical protein
LLGILLGTVIAYALTDSWFCPYQVCKLYHVPGGPVVGAIVGGAARGLPWALVAWFVARRYPQSSWIGFGALTCVMGSLSLTYCWLLVLDSHERRRWAARVPARFRFLSRARRREQEI